MGGASDKKVDDDSCSVESFEEVISKTAATVPKETKDFDDDNVPDVLYVVQYRNVSGRVVDTRKSSKPLNVTPLGEEDKSPAGKPVIEILTRVTATLKRKYPQGNAPAGNTGYVSDSEVDEESKDVRIEKVETTEMVIHSKHLQAALNAVSGYYPGVDFIGERVTVEAPYKVLIHCRKELELYKINQPSCHGEEYTTTTSKHIDVLLTFLRSTYGPTIEAEENRWNLDVPLATFDLFWLFLKPGEIIYFKANNRWVPSIISWMGPSHHTGNGKKNAYVIHCWNLCYHQGRIRRRMHSVTLHPFSGEQAIQGLNVIPARFFPGGAKAAAEKQIRLGKEYWELSKLPSHKEYEGDAFEKGGNSIGIIKGRVIIDCDGFGRYRDITPGAPPPPPPLARRPGMPPMIAPPMDQLPQVATRCGCQECHRAGTPTEPGPFAGFDNLDPNNDTPPENDLYFYVLSDLIPAFLLGERRWGMLEIEHLREIKYDREAFKYLVLDDEIKLTVKALIGKFASTDGKLSPWPSDFIRNKGEGRIFLLHGSPGVGKTCTAECVAELTHRPLLSLTSGDISTSGSTTSVESSLDFFLKLGERYGALVLLDEADVYLEERRTRDLHRNGLVSIFLRALEYYRGVLFLTTNRVEAFDSAFTSRIHVALHYKRLTDEDRMRIWMHNFERLERDSSGKVYVPPSTRAFCYESEDVRGLRWNGREIRNALQTAVALAESEALEDGVESVTLTDKHVRAVVKMSRGFKDYLHRHRGWADEDGYDEDDEADESDGYDSTSSSSDEAA
ncbi:ATPase [Thozetella sp. PMI_491]|nr:ATPase [Thozetella sp. PMI_491]